MNISPNSVLRKGYQSLCTNKESHLESSFQFFFVDFRSFLLEGIRVSSLGSLSFQAHLRLVWELLPTVVVSCFDRLAKKGVDWFHENISKRLHTHSLFSILSNLPMDSHSSHLRSCPGLRVGAQLFPCLIVLFFFGFKCFFLHDAHQLGSPPSIGPWLVTLHLWPTFKPRKDPPFSLCSW